jgi:hypothetical protein
MLVVLGQKFQRVNMFPVSIVQQSDQQLEPEIQLGMSTHRHPAEYPIPLNLAEVAGG